jgi:uncharacterized protein YjeT (DUF2065 family)
MAYMPVVPVLLAGLYLVVLAGVAFFRPSEAKRFLSTFASTPATHFVELFVRLVVGGCLVSYAVQMTFPRLFTVIGWTIVVTTLVLLFTPWRLHRRFAAWSVPLATRNMRLFAVSSLGAGVFLLVSLGF